MGNLIIRAGRSCDKAAHMFQVPASTEVGLVGRMIARTMNWDRDVYGQPVRYQIEAEQLGRLLSDGETLTQAGLFDTCLLILHSDSINQSRPDRAVALQKDDYSMNSMENPLNVATTSLQEDAVGQPVYPVSAGPPLVSSSAPVQGVPASQDQVGSAIPEPIRKSPVAGWKPLDIDIPDAAAVSDCSTEDSDQSGFVWKKLT